VPGLKPSIGFALLVAAETAACGSPNAAPISNDHRGDGGIAGVADAGPDDGEAPASPDRADGPITSPLEGSTAEAAAPSADTPAVETQVAALLGEMTLAEKIGQMVMADYTSLSSPDDVTTYFLGALLPSADEAPSPNAPQAWLDLANQLKPKALATRLGIPLILGIDAVHGNAKVAGATVFPHGIALGCSGDTALVTEVEQATAAEVLALGFSMSFSPDSDVGQDERWGRSYESFGEDPTLVSRMVGAAVTGYQTALLGSPGSVMASPKHYLGAGGTSWGTGVAGGIDQGDTQVTEAEMRAVHLPPFQAAVKAGAMAIMVSYSSWNGTKMSASSHWLTDVIKGELGYSGFLLSDFDAIRQLGGTGKQQAATAINAGLDMIMMSNGYTGFISDVTASVMDGTIAQTRIDDAVRRILRAKVVAGLFNSPVAIPLSTLGSAAHRQLARLAVQESLVLLKNDSAILPLSKSAHVVVAGPGANDVGVQSGGWTLGWQGVTQTNAAPIGGTTIFAGMQATASASSLVTYSWNGSSVPAGTSVGVVVLYENPYAEYEGDTNDPSFGNTSSSQDPSGHTIYDGLASGIVSNMESANIPLVLVLVTGRPVRIESYLPHFKAVVAAWLPGSEGEGVADVLYGDAKFGGTLSKSWPRDATTLPISSLQTGSSPLFAYGFGLKYP
jgi:beta-glucosidase